jgi:transcriptional regulator with XRE-family HTH domain
MTGAQLKWRRKRLDWTQAEMAKAVGVTRNTIARWERDAMRITTAMSMLIETVYQAAMKQKTQKKGGK